VNDLLFLLFLLLQQLLELLGQQLWVAAEVTNSRKIHPVTHGIIDVLMRNGRIRRLHPGNHPLRIDSQEARRR
jgi:hypothetical protein